MSDDKQEVEEEVSEESYFKSIEEMLDALVPPSEILINDVDGKEHRLPGAIPARRQVKVFREFRGIWDNEDVKTHMESAADYSVSGIAKAVMGVAFEEEVLESLGRAFKAAFPKSCGDQDPLDLFPVEEGVTALVPLFIRFIKRAGKTLIGLGQAAGM